MSEVKQYETMEEYLKDVFADEEFTRRVFAMDTPEEVQAALLEKGLDISIEDLMKLGPVVDAMIENNGELTPELLDEVAGGAISLVAGGALVLAPVKVLGATGVGLAVVALAAAGAGLVFGIMHAVRRRW